MGGEEPVEAEGTARAKDERNRVSLNSTERGREKKGMAGHEAGETKARMLRTLNARLTNLGLT